MAIKNETKILDPKVVRSTVGTHTIVDAIAVDDESLYASSRDGNLSIWKKTMLDFPVIIPRQTSSQIESLHSDGKYLYSGSITGDTVIRIYNHDMTLLKILEGHSGTIFDLATTDDVLVSGSGDATVKIWEKEDWQLAGSIVAQTYFVLCVAVDTDLIYAGGIDNCINIFTRENHDRITSLHGHNANILALAVDRNYLYSGSGELWWGGPGSPRPSTFESAVRVWDKEDWSCIAVLEGHSDNINAISVDTNYIYSASDDGTVRVYTKSDWTPRALIDPGAGRILDLDHDERYVYFGCADGSIRYIPKGKLVI